MYWEWKNYSKNWKKETNKQPKHLHSQPWSRAQNQWRLFNLYICQFLIKDSIFFFTLNKTHRLILENWIMHRYLSPNNKTSANKFPFLFQLTIEFFDLMCEIPKRFSNILICFNLIRFSVLPSLPIPHTRTVVLHGHLNPRFKLEIHYWIWIFPTAKDS